MRNSNGKVITIFLVIFAILLISLTAISMFFFQKEIERRKSSEASLDQITAQKIRLETDLTEAQKQAFVLEQKNKEADEKINSLLDDLELEKGLREEVKKENQELKASLEQEAKVKDELNSELDISQRRVQELEGQLAQEVSRRQEIENLSSQLQEHIKELESARAAGNVSTPQAEQVQLEPIVVAPSAPPVPVTGKEGKILTVDKDNDFIIVNLGERDGVAEGALMSIYKGDEYLGDVKVSRVQPAMSAADFVPPLSSQNISKSDRVVRKQ